MKLAGLLRQAEALQLLSKVWPKTLEQEDFELYTVQKLASVLFNRNAAGTTEALD